MAEIHTEERNGIKTRYVNAQDGVKLYLLPNVPMDAGEIPTEKGFDLEGAVSKFPEELQDRTRRIGEQYSGRQLDAVSILLYAKEKGEFDNYASRLESKPKDFEFIHPELMMARTDVSAFFMRLYADLGVAPIEEADRAERQIKRLWGWSCSSSEKISAHTIFKV
ncbi:MAG: hypothetical protein KKF68_00605 [Nanoarchaeota archaeon]|nr:hypothetical protein [Nanoarchaeota archaeon]